MFAKLFPRETCFFKHFEKQADLLVQCAKELAILLNTNQDIKEKAKQIHQLEHEADIVTHSCLEDLHKSFITPFERDDIYNLINQLDDVIDYADDAAQCLVSYKINSIQPDACALAKILEESTLELQKLIYSLRNPKLSDSVREEYKNIHDLENQGVKLLHQAVGHLFENESDTKNIIKWHKIYDLLEAAIDSCEDVSNTIELMILEST